MTLVCNEVVEFAWVINEVFGAISGATLDSWMTTSAVGFWQLDDNSPAYLLLDDTGLFCYKYFVIRFEA